MRELLNVCMPPWLSWRYKSVITQCPTKICSFPIKIQTALGNHLQINLFIIKYFRDLLTDWLLVLFWFSVFDQLDSVQNLSAVLYAISVEFFSSNLKCFSHSKAVECVKRSVFWAKTFPLCIKSIISWTFAQQIFTTHWICIQRRDSFLV